MRVDKAEVLVGPVALVDPAVQKVVVLVLVDKVEVLVGPVALVDPAVQKVVVQALVDKVEVLVGPVDPAVQKVVVLVLVDKAEVLVDQVALVDPAVPAVQKVVVQALVDKAEVLVGLVDLAVQKDVVQKVVVLVDPAVQKVVALRDNVTIRCAWSIMRWSSMPIRMASLIGTNCSSSLGTCLVLVIKALVDPVDPVALAVALTVEVQADPVVVVVDRAVLKVAQKVVAHNDRNAPNKLTTDNHVYEMSFPVQEKLEHRMKPKSR